VLPGATVTIHPDPVAVGPESYSVRPPVQPSDTEPLESTKQGEATGHRTRRTPATGVVTLYNYSPFVVFVPQGTIVSADGVVLFATRQAVSVPDSAFFFAGTADVEVEAVDKGRPATCRTRQSTRSRTKRSTDSSGRVPRRIGAFATSGRPKAARRLSSIS
jgi:hypothetical protein